MEAARLIRPLIWANANAALDSLETTVRRFSIVSTLNVTVMASASKMISQERSASVLEAGESIGITVLKRCRRSPHEKTTVRKDFAPVTVLHMASATSSPGSVYATMDIEVRIAALSSVPMIAAIEEFASSLLVPVIAIPDLPMQIVDRKAVLTAAASVENVSIHVANVHLVLLVLIARWSSVPKIATAMVFVTTPAVAVLAFRRFREQVVILRSDRAYQSSTADSQLE